MRTHRRGGPRPPAMRIPVAILLVVVALVLAACRSGSGGAPSATVSATPTGPPSGTLRLYTSVTQDTVDAVLAAYRTAAPGVQVDVFRAPTGQLDARIASELRSGGVGADVLWGTDPLSIEAWAAKGLFEPWTPADAAVVPPAYHTDTFWGTRILDMVIVRQPGLAQPPTDWHDLADPSLSGAVAIPDPGFAGSAFAALGYFATAAGYGMDYYRALKANGASQVQSVTDIVSGVASGQFKAGITLAKLARDAIAKGSPLEIAWPASGAIAIYSPIAIIQGTRSPTLAASFASFVLSRDGQAAIASTGWQPIRRDVTGGPSVGGPEVAPDWSVLFSREDELLAAYRAIFGG
jgi:iron(III) transport system substrate-binding protein